jgi:hypothetical protein
MNGYSTGETTCDLLLRTNSPLECKEATPIGVASHAPDRICRRGEAETFEPREGRDYL